MIGARAFRLLSELRRRRVFRVTLVYLAVSWGVIEIGSALVDALGLAPQLMSVVVVLIALAFPLVVVLAWAYDVTPVGVRRTPPLDAGGWQQVQDLFAESLELPPARRAEWLASSGTRPDVLREVASLLESHEREGRLDQPLEEWIEVPARTDAPAPGRSIGPYRIEDRLGGGGMGVVYRARDERLARTVALKFLPPHLGVAVELKQRFLQEARTAAALEHPNICTILDVGESASGQLFIAMPCYDGETLKRRIARGPLAVDDAIDIALQAARGLAKAHERGIIHRDIKPANLIITSDDVLKIVDFGIAKLADHAATGPWQPFGTLAYMSPEQAQGDAVDARSDLWSLGVVVHEMLTGERPFRGASDQLLLNAITNGERPRATVADDEDRALEGVLGLLLARAPAHRYAGAVDLIRDLERIVAARARAQATHIVPAPVARDEALPALGERRQATVVVASLSGYAGLVERLVPEDLERLLAVIHEDVREIAQRLGGIVNQCADDEMVLLFGIPASHEDHAVRAVRAALEMVSSMRELRARSDGAGSEARLHTGIATGALIAQTSENPAMKYRVSGTALHIARRLSTQAGADAVWITPECHRLVGPFFETEALAPLQLREQPDGITPHLVLRHTGMRTRLDAAMRTGLTEYVGREAELERVLGALESTRAGAGRLVLVTGEAGMGKSRLLLELRRRIGNTAVSLVQGRCQPVDAGNAYGPFVEVLRSLFGLADGAGGGAAALAVPDWIRRHAPELEPHVPLYLHVLSADAPGHVVPDHMPAEQLRVAVQEAIAALLTLAARAAPLVLMLEDWHWADDASHATLRQVADLDADYPLLTIVTSRTGGPQDFGGQHNQSVIALEPLPADASRAMLRSILHADQLPGDLAELLHDRAGGNPFFLEEICHALLEEGTLRVHDGVARLSGTIADLQLPDTVQAVIRTRLDRLESEARDVLRTAAVIGRSFSRPLLEAALPDVGRLPNALQSLKGTGLIRQTSIVPEVTYRFRHALTQDVAYGSLLAHQCEELHGRVARAIELIHADHLDEHVGDLARHYSLAGDWLRAIEFALRSAERLNALAESPEMLQILEQCEEWLEKIADEEKRAALRIQVLLRQERLSETLGERGHQQELIDRLLTLLEESSDRTLLAEVYLRQGDLFTLLRRFDDAERVLGRSLDIRRGLGAAAAERNTLRSLGLMHWHRGTHASAIEYIRAALDIDRVLNDTQNLIGDLSNLGILLKSNGDLEGARQALHEALDTVEAHAGSVSEMSQGVKLTYTLHNLANVYRELGDNGKARELLERSIGMTSSRHLPLHLSYHYMALAHIALTESDTEESLRCYDEAVRHARAARFAPGVAHALRTYGEVLATIAREEEALANLHEAADIYHQLEAPTDEAIVWRTIARTCERMSRPAQAEQAWQRTAERAHAAGALPVELEALESLGRTASASSDGATGAAAYLEAALELAERLDDDEARGRIHNSLGIRAWSRADYESAVRHYRRALAIFRALGDTAAIGLTLNSLGATHLRLGDLDRAELAVAETLELHRPALGGRLEADARSVLADVLERRGDVARALDESAAAVALRVDAGDRAGAGWLLQRMARLARRTGNTGRAHDLARQAGAIADDVDDLELKAAIAEQLTYQTEV